MPEVHFVVALVGRNSRCKRDFFQAASSSENIIASSSVDTQAWITTAIAPRDVDLNHAPANGFSPAGERLLPVQLKQMTAGDITAVEFGDKARAVPFPTAVLLLVPAEVVFHKGKPRPGNPIRAAVTRLQERLGSSTPLAVAVSVDVEEAGSSKLVPAAVKSFLATTKGELNGDGIPVVPVSPATEIWLREQQSEGGRISYRRGDTNFRIRAGFEQVMDKYAIERARVAFDVCGGTGIQVAVSAAVALQPTALAFPVGDFHTLQSSSWAGDGAPMAVLRTCRLLHADSTARALFAAEKADGTLAGDLVRAEIVPFSVDAEARADPVALDLDRPLGEGAWLVRLTTNRKPVQIWQVGATAVAAAGGKKASKALAAVQFGDLRSKERRRGKS